VTTPASPSRRTNVAGTIGAAPSSTPSFTVLPDLHGTDDVRRGFCSLRERFGDRLAAVVVQPMTTSGVQVTISVSQEQLFGPLVLFGLGVATDALADRAARPAPLTDSDADDLIRSVPGARRLLGRPGAPATDLAALRDMLLRVSQMADHLPHVAELELSPVVDRRRPLADGVLHAYCLGCLRDGRAGSLPARRRPNPGRRTLTIAITQTKRRYRLPIQRHLKLYIAIR
jgi:ATP-grasp domain